MSAPRLHLHRPDEPADAPSIDAAGAARAQTADAESSLYRAGTDWLRLPWPSLDALVDGIGAGEVWFVGGFSGTGKTTFLMNLVRLLLDEDRTVYYVGTETKPHELRTRLACVREGIYAGDVLSGKAERSYTHWDAVRARLVADIREQGRLGPRNRFLVCPVRRVDAGGITSAFHDASLQAADVLIIDHIDHITHGQSRSGFEDSRMLAHLVLDLAEGSDVPTLVATQFNNEAVRGDVFGAHRPPQPHHVYMGGHKRQIAWGFLGLYRPLSTTPTAADLKAVRAGMAPVSDFVRPGVLAASCMKSRNHGAHEGKVAMLGFDAGRLVDLGSVR